jgi:AAA family ATP:ADP antiporter
LAKLKYWVAIGLIVGLYEMVSGIIDFQLSLTVEKINGSPLQKDVYFGYVGTAQNLVALLVQMFLTGYVIRHWGLKTALLILPLTLLLGSVGFLAVPSLAGAMFLAVTDNGLNYSLNQQAKETLYVPTPPEERLRAKAFIDLFVQRFAKAAAVGLNLFVVASNGLDAARWLTLAVVPLAIVWILVVRFTGKEFEQLVMMNPPN